VRSFAVRSAESSVAEGARVTRFGITFCLPKFFHRDPNFEKDVISIFLGVTPPAL
jgi:hypothetical protein